MKKCAQECVKRNKKCSQEECRLWMNYEGDLNCSLVAIQRHGEMTLHEVADRLEMSYVRIKQIQDAAIKKIRPEDLGDELFVLDDGFF